MAPRKGRRRLPFDKPGRATLWGLLAVPLSAAVTIAGTGLAGLVAVALGTALVGCYNPDN